MGSPDWDQGLGQTETTAPDVTTRPWAGALASSQTAHLNQSWEAERVYGKLLMA